MIFWSAIAVLGALGFIFGIFTAIWPNQSIRLYQRIMEKLNWRVAPIDEAHEIRMTRILGSLLVLLSAGLLYLFYYHSACGAHNI